MENKKIHVGGGGQSSYNLPTEFMNFAVENEVLIKDSSFDYNRKEKDGDAYILHCDFKLKLTDTIYWLIGDEYKKNDNKLVASVGYKNNKLQFFRAVYSNLGDNYKWFVKLYDKNLVGNELVLSIDMVNKVVEIDVELKGMGDNSNSNEVIEKEQIIDKDYNRIIFGAPGTGKSYRINDEKEAFGENYERVTFNPTYSYAQFFGTYKPVTDENEDIKYKFVPGPFLRVLIKALKGKDNQLLIVEEINRANVAAVFGDIFQLLDRNKDGVSEYSINTTEDVKRFLINECDFLEKEAEKLRIPSNMYIWATMNSADQGVQPMDAAFKRRWSFEYIGINEGANKISELTIKLNPYKEIKWDYLRRSINQKLLKLGVNEDKLIGPYFLSEKELRSNNIDSIFKSKVLMYLYEDVLKHKKGKMFNDGILTFSDIVYKYNKKENIFKENIFEDEYIYGDIEEEKKDRVAESTINNDVVK